MPRAERPLDDQDSELGSFAAGLRRLREKAGTPSYRALASRAHYSAATLSDAAGGKKLPSLAVTLAYVNACGADPSEWEERWRAIAAPPDPSGEAPYVGLESFQKEDADRFFGREKLTAKLVDLVARRPLVGVFGASGSGKSSLLRAGLLPRLDNALIFTPGVQPVDECAVRFAQLTGESAVTVREELSDPDALGLRCKQHDVVLVVDQFEEVFTLCGPEQRDWFVRALVAAPHVVIGVRADFYGHIGRHPELVEALEGAQLLVGPLGTDELRRAITEPAQRVGATVETALVTRLVADVAGQTAALPLVQHALVETWHRRRGMTLSLVGYEEAGGVEHAIARTAEAVYSALRPDQQEIARRTFLRLIALGDGTEDTKRRAAREDLDADVLEHLAAARLVTLGTQHAELAHEALIRSWPRLSEWIAENRDTLRAHHQLTDAATAWDGHDRDVLYKGVRLAQASALDSSSLTGAESAFLAASQAAGRRRARRTRIVVSVLSALVLLLASTVVFAIGKAEDASRQRDIAAAGGAAAEARWLARQPNDIGQAIRIALAVYRVSPTEANRDLVLSASAAGQRRELVSGQPGRRYEKQSGGRFYLRADEAGKPELWDPRSKRTVSAAALPSHPIAVSGDDRFAVYGHKEAFSLWDVTDLERPRELTGIPQSTHTSIATSGFVVTIAGMVQPPAGVWGLPRVWIYEASRGLRELAVPGEKPAIGIDLSADGRTLVLLRGEPQAVEIWRVEAGELHRVSETLTPVYPATPEFSADGRFLALGNAARGKVEVLDVSDPTHLKHWAELSRQTVGRANPMVKFSADGRRVLIATDRTAYIWSLERRDAPELLAGFDNFMDGVTAVDYWPETDEFVAMTGGEAIWPLHTDVDQIRRDMCQGGAELSDDE